MRSLIFLMSKTCLQQARMPGMSTISLRNGDRSNPLGTLASASYRRQVPFRATRRRGSPELGGLDHAARACFDCIERLGPAQEISLESRAAQFDQNGVLLTGFNAFGDNHDAQARSEEHTSELQSRENLVCRLLLEKKK